MSKEEPKKEKIILAVIYKQDGNIGIEYPNNKDTMQFELYGFLKILTMKMVKDLMGLWEDI